MPKRVLVTGANGTIGNAVARAFVRAGWTTYGLVRREKSLVSLQAEEIIPLLGSPGDLSFIESLHATDKSLDVIVSTTESWPDYVSHYNEIINFVRTLAVASNEVGTRPLVLFTSGCKDYGTAARHGEANLAPHTESSPLNPPTFLQDRTTHAIKIFDHNDLFDAAVLRPTTIFGLHASFYGPVLEVGAAAAERGVLEISSPSNSIMHGLHVDDCGEAYVALAEHSDRAAVSGQCFNVSGRTYETAQQIVQALVTEYQVKDGFRFLDPSSESSSALVKPNDSIFDFTQWVESDKIRKLTGWRDRRPLFTEGIHAYRLAYEAAVKSESENVAKLKQFMKVISGSGGFS